MERGVRIRGILPVYVLIPLNITIDLQNQRVEIYRPGQDVEVLQSPTSLSGEDVLPEFVLELTQILN
jgi:Uma2 family endonuclease